MTGFFVAAQHTYGAAWDYDFFKDEKMPIEAKRQRGTFANWIG